MSSRIRAALLRLAQFPRDARGLSLLEILVALDKFAEEARWTTRLVRDAEFFARSPAAPLPVPCPGGLCPGSVNIEIPRGNPVIPDCSYFVRFARDPADNTFTRLVKSDPTASADDPVDLCRADRYRDGHPDGDLQQVAPEDGTGWRMTR